MKAPEILKQAAEHMEDRAATYDAPEGERSMNKTVEAFNTLYGLSLTEEQGWAFMVLLKLVRSSQGEYRADNYEDLTAYASLMGEAANYGAKSAPILTKEGYEDLADRMNKAEGEGVSFLHLMDAYSEKLAAKVPFTGQGVQKDGEKVVLRRRAPAEPGTLLQVAEEQECIAGEADVVLKEETFCPPNCRHLSPTEEEQDAAGWKAPHICTKFNEQLLHNDHHPHICRAKACEKEVEKVCEVYGDATMAHEEHKKKYAAGKFTTAMEKAGEALTGPIVSSLEEFNKAVEKEFPKKFDSSMTAMDFAAAQVLQELQAEHAASISKVNVDPAATVEKRRKQVEGVGMTPTDIREKMAEEAAAKNPDPWEDER